MSDDFILMCFFPPAVFLSLSFCHSLSPPPLFYLSSVSLFVSLSNKCYIQIYIFSVPENIFKQICFTNKRDKRSGPEWIWE